MVVSGAMMEAGDLSGTWARADSQPLTQFLLETRLLLTAFLGNTNVGRYCVNDQNPNSNRVIATLSSAIENHSNLPSTPLAGGFFPPNHGHAHSF